MLFRSPMPQKRIANMTSEWYAKTLDRTLVPLPEKEWNRLRHLALGTVKFEGPIPRRPLASSHQQPELSALKLALGVSPLDNPRSIVHMLSKPVHGHAFTPRFMRRLWASVFAQCPVMTWDSSSQNWNIEWRSESTRLNSSHSGESRMPSSA